MDESERVTAGEVFGTLGVFAGIAVFSMAFVYGISIII